MYKHFNVIWKGDWKQTRSIENKISLQMSEICGPSQKLIRWQMTRTRGHKGRITWEEKKVTGMAWGVLNEESSMHCNEGGRESFHAFLVWVSVGQGALCQHQSRFCCLLFKRKVHQSRYITILMSDSLFFFFHDTSNFTMFWFYHNSIHGFSSISISTGLPKFQF